MIVAFEIFYKRCKALKDYFAASPNGEDLYNYCKSNFHFLKTFECFLYQLVKAGEITEKFDNLTKITAGKIEKFIKDKLMGVQALSDANERLAQSIKEFESEFRRAQDKLRDRQAQRRAEFQAEMDSLSLPSESLTSLLVDNYPPSNN